MTDIEPPTRPESMSEENSPQEEAPNPPEEQPNPRFPPLTKAEKWTFPFVAVGALAIGGIGLYSSFDNVTKHMEDAEFENPELVPIAIDIAIPVFSLLYLILIRTNRPLAWPRWLAWALTLVTIHLNVASTNNLDAKIAHAALPALWIGITEIIAHIYRVEIGEANGTRPDPIPFIDWILAPFATAHLYRYMRLWKITSHKEGLAKKQQRIRAITALRKSYGRAWRFKAPLDLRSELGLGELTEVRVYKMAQLGEPSTQDLLNIALERAPRTPSATPQLPAAPQGSPRELANPDEQTALPPGSRSVEASPEADVPYESVGSADTSLAFGVEDQDLGVTKPVTSVYTPQPLPAQRARVTASVESKDEREVRELKAELQASKEREDSYKITAAVVLDMLKSGEIITGPKVAEHPDVPVGKRTVQRHLQKMQREGLIGEDTIKH